MLGFQEVVLIFAILLLILGPTKLPELARAIGKAVREFNRASQGLAEAIESPIEEIEREVAPSPAKSPATIAAKSPTSSTAQSPTLTEGKPIKQGDER